MVSCQKCSSSWKGGISIDNLTRKEIWEENYKIRESLRGVQQSQHFWDFQMSSYSKSGCHCETPKKLFPRCKSLHAIDKISQMPRKVITPSVAQAFSNQHNNVICSGRCKRDVGTTTSPPRVDKSVGTGPRKVELAPSRNSTHRPFIVGVANNNYNQRDRPQCEWSRNEVAFSKQQRQESLQRLRKSEEALQQALQRKRVAGNSGHWGTEYTRSFKDAGGGGWTRTVPRRAGTPIPRQSSPFFGNCRTPILPRPVVG